MKDNPLTRDARKLPSLRTDWNWSEPKPLNAKPIKCWNRPCPGASFYAIHGKAKSLWVCSHCHTCKRFRTSFK